MTHRTHAPRAAAAMAMAGALLAGCAAPLQPVADFGGAATRLAAAYRPFARGAAQSCEQRQHYIAIGSAGAFDDAATERAAAATCAPLREAGTTAALLAESLAGYAGALAKAAGAKPTAFDSGIRGMSSAAGDLQQRDGSALFASTQIAAAARIARNASAMLQQGRLRALTRAALQDNHEPLREVVDAMKTYAGSVYAGQLADTRAVMVGELARLVQASAAPAQAEVEARLPWRFAQAATRADIAANDLEARHVREFVKAADALVAAHADLVANFDRIDGARRLELVAAFVEQVQAIGEDAEKL